MHDAYRTHLRRTLDGIRAEGFYKAERIIGSPQSPAIRLADGKEVLNFCANNYLGLADDPRLIAAAKDGLDAYGFGMASVRFICGTQTLHRELERAIATYLKKDDAILFAKQRFEQAAVGVEAAAVKDGIVRAEEPGKRGLEILVHALRAADEAH